MGLVEKSQCIGLGFMAEPVNALVTCLATATNFPRTAAGTFSQLGTSATGPVMRSNRPVSTDSTALRRALGLPEPSAAGLAQLLTEESFGRRGCPLI